MRSQLRGATACIELARGSMDVESTFDCVRAIALALPEVTERISHGEPCFFVGSRALCYFHDDHNGDGRVSLWCPVPPGVRDDLVVAEPERFFRPTPSARGAFSTWLGVYLDLDEPVNWSEIAAILAHARSTIT